MPEGSTSFYQITPQTNRITGINYVAVPMPAASDGDEVEVSILPNQLVITYDDES